jgi:hypothetical protein
MLKSMKIASVSMKAILLGLMCSCWVTNGVAEDRAPQFQVIAFYTGKNDQAHISFAREANQWFPKKAAEQGFSYDSTTNWNNLNAQFLSSYRVVLFLDIRPEAPEQRAAFKQYMEHGVAWMGFHFAAFALTPSGVPQNWDWYHHQFLGSGEYQSNTWRPTPAVLRVENRSERRSAISWPYCAQSQSNRHQIWRGGAAGHKKCFSA